MTAAADTFLAVLGLEQRSHAWVARKQPTLAYPQLPVTSKAAQILTSLSEAADGSHSEMTLSLDRLHGEFVFF